MDDVLLSVDQVTKTFTGVVALENASLSLRRGEIVALVGANGAGKSTLIKIISGVYPPDSGTVQFHGEPMETFTPAEELRRGVSTIYQDFNLVPSLSVA